MPAPKTPISIGFKGLEANASVKCTNFTTSETIHGVAKEGNVVLDPANSGFTWNEGDSVQLESNGIIVAVLNTTISKRKAELETTTTADTSTPAVSL